MTSLALTLLLAAAPARPDAPPPAGGWEIEEVDGDELADLLDDERPPRFPRFVRAGLGVSRLLDLSGFAPGGEVGVEIKFRDWLGLRAAFATALRFDWGAVAVAPELVYYPAPRAAISPYVAAGVQAGMVNLATAVRKAGLSRASLAVVRQAAAGGGLPAEVPMDGSGGAHGPTPLAFSFGPQATAGVLLWLTPSVAIDVGLRYASLRWHDDRFGGVGGLVAIVAPM